jgi:hypothetical protein
MAKIESSRVAGTRPDGSRIILPETETRVRNKRTGWEYSSEEEARADVENPGTDTTEDDIAQDTTLRVLKGVDSEGGAG